jgi:hypothetical protein
VIDSGIKARHWDRDNFARSCELNDMLDACPDHRTKRALYATFTEEEKNGLIIELCRRKNDREFPIGCMVRSAHEKHGMSVMTGRGTNSVTHVSHSGLATLLGSPERGSHRRYVMLHPAWVNKEGQRIMFGEASIVDMRVVSGL